VTKQKKKPTEKATLIENKTEKKERRLQARERSKEGKALSLRAATWAVGKPGGVSTGGCGLGVGTRWGPAAGPLRAPIRVTLE